jgi:hypothetical protein
MKPVTSACERCGLREVRHELEKKGIMIRFCDECYWGETGVPADSTGAGAQPGVAPSQPKRKTA